MNLELLTTILTFGLAGYVLYSRYRSATSLNQPPPLELWLASKDKAVLRKIGLSVFTITAAASYAIWQLNLDSGWAEKPLFLFALFSLILILKPEEWLEEAYLFHHNPKLWKQVKAEVVADLKKNYFKIFLQRLAIAGIAVYLLIKYLP